MTMVTNTSPKAGAKPNRQQRRQAARRARKVERSVVIAAAARGLENAIARDIESANRLHQMGALQGAADAYSRILHRKPDHCGALHRLGLIAYQSGQGDTAVELIRRALAIDPGQAEAHNTLGVVLQMLGRPDEALASFRRAAAADPNFVDAHSNLGVLLKDHGRSDEAVSCFRRALAIDPNHADAQNNLGIALQTMGKFDEAAIEYERALAIRPGHAVAYKNLASVRKVRPGDPLIVRIEALLQRHSLCEDDRTLLHFALGKCFDDLGEYDQAFRHYQVANRIRKESSEFAAAAYAKETDRLIATFTREFFEQRARFGTESERPVFILGMPRSGTTLVEQIMASHASVFGAGELNYFNQIARDLPTMLNTAMTFPECTAHIVEETARGLAKGYLDQLRGLSEDAARVTDKMPGNFRHIGLIALLFPQARIIHCRRHPIDVCLSCYFQDFRSQPFSYDLADIGQYYREYERLMGHWSEVVMLPVMEVRYEDLIADVEKVGRQIIDFCGIGWDDACLTPHRNDRPITTASLWQARQPVYKTSVRRWERYEANLGPLKEALAGAA